MSNATDTTNNINAIKGIRDSSTDRTIVALCNAVIDALETVGDSPSFTNITVSNLATILTAAITTGNVTTLIAGVGAVGTPSYTFTGDLNTGLYWIAADHFALVCNGVVVMDITETNIDLNLTNMSMPLLATDTINEKTTNAGVTVEGVKAENGGLTTNSETLIVPFYPQGLPEDLSGAGFPLLTSYQTRFSSIGTGDALSLADGTQIGQMKEFNYIAETGGTDTGVITLTGYVSITLNAIGDLVILMWNGAAWKIMKNIGCTVI